MKLKIFLSAVVAIASTCANAVEITDAHRQRARKLVEQMTLDEKIRCLGGKTSFSLWGNERLGIPEIWLADGPQGLRNHAPHSTLYPAGILAAATWNRDIAARYGESLGDDARARGVGILLGPGVNIYRSPLCGRNYEYMGEDPYLASEIATEYIKGVQSKGVIATVKHFAANNQEWSRHHASSDVDERTLHEIYFPAFRKAVQVAGVGAVMNSYNLLNGVHATQNRWLNTDILRNLWGFNGILMSDWTSVYSTVNATASGLDLEMPKPVFYKPEKIKDALANGRITEEMINGKVEHLLSTFIAFGLLERVQKDSDIPLDYEKSRLTALETAREGIVLLKNNGNILPLKGKTLVLGPNCDTIMSGGGSGSVSPFSVTPVSKALRQMRKNTVVLPESRLYYDITSDVFTDSTCSRKGFTGRYYKNQKMEGTPDVVRTDSAINFFWEYKAPFPGFPEDHFSATWSGFYRPSKDGIIKIRISGDDGYRVIINGKTVTGDWGNHALSTREIEYEVSEGKGYDIRVDYFDNISSANIICTFGMMDEETLNRELRRADNVVYCTGFNSGLEGEGFDRPFAIPAFQEKFINRLASLNPNLTVVLNAGGGVDFSRWGDAAKAILLAWYPGQEGGQAIAEILTGKLSPSGKLPISIEAKPEDNPCFDSYYANNDKVRSNDSRECRHVEYKEGIFSGYRGYDRNGVRPLYPFGFGLGYSRFEFSDLTLTPADNDKVEVSFTIRNTGKMEASEVAQIYVTDNECSQPRPLKELKGFEKVKLQPGKSQRVNVVLDKDAFSFYNPDLRDFVVEPGSFTISVGNSSDNLPLSGMIDL